MDLWNRVMIVLLNFRLILGIYWQIKLRNFGLKFRLKDRPNNPQTILKILAKINVPFSRYLVFTWTWFLWLVCDNGLVVENLISQKRNIRFGTNFQDILKTIRPIFWQNIRPKLRNLIFQWLSTDRLKIQ